MTNKKLKMAAMSVALTACVAASPLAANADAPEAAPEKTEPVAEETKKEENTAEPQDNKQSEKAQETLKNAEVKYDKEHPTTNPDGSQKLDGVIVTKPEGSGETNPNPNPDSGETNPNPNPGSGETAPEEKKSEEKKPEEKEPEEKKPEQIGTAEKTEKSETTVETKPNPGAEPIVDTTTPPTVEKNPDGSTAITQPTVTPGKETTTTTGTGEAKGDLHEKEEEVPKKDIDLKKELGEKPDISWQIKKDDEAVNGYKVEEVTNSEDGNQQTLKLKKEEETTAEMTAEDIAKLVDAEKPTVNPDGTYTLTRTETIPDAEGNPQTRTTYITIQGSKVTTKTTTELTITRQKAKLYGDAEIEDKVEYPSITVTNQAKPEDTQTITPDQLKEMLDKGEKKDDGIHYTKDGKEYVIQVGPEIEGEPLSNAEIVAKLNNARYTLGKDDGEIYYTTDHGEKVKLEKVQKEHLRWSLTYKVTLKTTEKGEKETAGEQIATEKAKKDAIRSALTKAVDKLGIEDAATAAQLKAKISDLKFTQEQLDNGDTFKVKLDDGKTYILTYSAAGATVTSTPTEDKTGTGKKPEDITDVMDNTVKGTAYVTGSKITYQAGAEYKTTGVDTLGMGADFKTAPKDAVQESIQWDTAGRITSYTDTKGNTHTFKYDDNVDLNALTPEEKTALEAAANKDKDGWTTKDLTANLTRVKWTVVSSRTVTDPIEGEPVDLLSEKKAWSIQSGNDGTFNFTDLKPNGTTYTGMTLEGTSQDAGTQTYKKTEDNGTVTIITVTTRQLSEADIKAKFDDKFGAGKYTINPDQTVTYEKDGKTYKASYVAQEEELTVEVQKPHEVAATGSTDAEAQAAFLTNLEKARKEAKAKGEELVIEYDDNGVIKTLKVDREMKWEEVSMVVGHVVNYNAMTDAELVTYLKELETAAKNTGKYYDGSTKGDTPYYWDANNEMMKRVPKGVEVETEYQYVLGFIPVEKHYAMINGARHEVHYNDNYIEHLDLATDSHLTLSEKNEEGNPQTTDCVLLKNPKLTWSEDAGTLVKGGGTQANFVDRITYDHENDNDESTGHYEYPRASWDKDHGWAIKSEKNNAPTKSVFYKVEGKVAYGKWGDAYEKKFGDLSYAAAKNRAEADLKKYIADHPEMDLSKAQVVEIYKDQYKYGERYYQIYLYQSDLTAYGYMSDDNNTCGNALFEPGSKTYYIGGYDLTLGNLTQTDKKHVVAMGKNTTALSATFKRRKLENLTNRELRYTPNSVTTTEQGTDLSGSYQANYTKTADYRDEQQQGGIAGTGTGSYKSFTNLIRNIFKGEDTGTVEGGSIEYKYHSEKDKDGTPVKFEADQMVVTTKQDAEVHYTFTSQESRDVWIKGYTQTVVPPVNPGPDTPELPPVEDAKPAPAPAPAPEAPVLPVVQDARPDPAPTPAPAPAPAPETPVLPAVQDAKLIQTGTSGWLADLMLGAGMVLSAAGYWMERKRKAMFYKSQH